MDLWLVNRIDRWIIITLSPANPETTPKIKNPAEKVPVMSFNHPKPDGSRNPPIPPAAPMKPDAVPIMDLNR
jgi:hypothetical protein